MKNVSVKVLGKEYQISCPLGAEMELIDAANYLDQKMIEIRGSGRIITFENILMTVAINLSHEILQLNTKRATDTENLVDTVTSLQNKLSNALKTIPFVIKNSTKQNSLEQTEFAKTNEDCDNIF